MVVYLYLLIVCLPAALGKCSIRTVTPEFSRSVYRFSTDLNQKLGHETENNFIASPLSLWTLLSSLSMGARGSTREQIKKTLRQRQPSCNEKFMDLVKRITEATNETTLERSSVMFVSEELQVKEKYIEKLNKTGVCVMKRLPFGNTEALATTINDYVKQATHDTIQKVVSADSLQKVLMVLVDAIYFKGGWKYPFDEASTEPTTAFHDERGNHVGNVNMMHGWLPLLAANMVKIKSKVLELPYGNQDRFSMLFFLPHANTSVTNVMSLLRNHTIQSIYSKLEDFPEETMDVRIPRFKISSDMTYLREVLVSMGLTAMFDSTAADFSKISDRELHVSKILQKAEIEVTEKGTVASAASAAEMTSRNLPEEFTANKPFLFMIVDKLYYIPLFTGAYSKPSIF